MTGSIIHVSQASACAWGCSAFASLPNALVPSCEKQASEDNSL